MDEEYGDYYDSQDDDDDIASDEYYDEEADEENDEDNQEIEIFIGRDPNNLDRLSNIDLGGRQGSLARRDDLLSLNNMSIDLLNAQQLFGQQRNAGNANEDQESVDQSENNNNQNEGSHDHNAISHRVPRNVLNLDGGNILNDILGMFLGRNRSYTIQQDQPGQFPNNLAKNLIQSTLIANNIAHIPMNTLEQIFGLGRQLQLNTELYRMFIREQPDHDQKLPNNQQQTSANNSRSNNQQVQINTNSIFEDVDPEFLSNLDGSAIQDLQDTENVIQRLHNQSIQNQPQRQAQSIVDLLRTVQNQEQRNTIFRGLADEVFQQLPAQLFSEGLQYRRAPRHLNQPALNQVLNIQINDQGQNNDFQIQLRPNDRLPIQALGALGAGRPRLRNQNDANARGRLMSLDSQFNDLADFSRSANDPFFRNNNVISKVPSKIQEFSVEANSLFNDFVNHLKDLISEMNHLAIYDNKGNDIGKSSEHIIQYALILSGDNYEQNYQRLSGFVEMIMVWIKYLTNGAFVLYRENSLLRIILRTSYLRCGINTSILKWFTYGINNFEKYADQIKQLEAEGQGKNLAKPFKIDRGQNLPGKIEIMDFVPHCLRCFKQIITESNKISYKAGLDLLRVPSQDPHQNLITQVFNKQDPESSSQIDLNTPFIDQIIGLLAKFVGIIQQRHDMINIQEYMIDGQEVWLEPILNNVVGTFRQLALAYEKTNQIAKEQNQLPTIKFHMSNKLIENLGQVLLSQQTSKEILKEMKNLLNDITILNNNERNIIESFFKNSLSQTLNQFIEVIQQPKINVDLLKKQVQKITQIIKIASNNKRSEINICDQELFFRVVKEISVLIDQKQVEQQHNTHQSQASFIFKEEFRTVMLALFILFEYNLKFIFTDQQDDNYLVTKRRSNAQNQRRANQHQNQQQLQQQVPAENGQINEAQNAGLNQPAVQINTNQNHQQQQNNKKIPDIEMQGIEEMKAEILGESPKKDTFDLMEAIEQHLQIKIKDEKARQDNRLKIFIKFCLEHKKIINSFIRVNQQVLNESLRNVIMKVPQILDFDNKRLLFRSQIKKMQRKYRLKYIDIEVRRDCVFDDSYEQLKNVGIDRWKGQLNIEFAGEQGIDEGGLSREWFVLISQGIFNPDLALFLQSNAGTTYYPNPQSTIQEDYFQLFKFIGRIVAKALYEQQLLDCYFVKALYKIILGMPLSYHDVEDFDNELYKNLKWCLENSVDFLGLTFTETANRFGENIEEEIMPGGKDIDVTEDNKFEYVQKKAYHKLYGSIKKQVDAFLQGFHEIIPRSLIQIFDNRELELLISGLPNIDIMDLKENTIYTNYTADTPVVKWLFEVLEEFDNSERAEFLQFVTGSSKVPVEGFKGLRGSRGLQKFQIVKFFTDNVNRLPQAHTCFKQLELPEYQSREQLKERLLTAIKEGKTFGFA